MPIKKCIYPSNFIFIFFYIFDCVLLKFFSPFCWTWFQLLQKQLNLSKNAKFQINFFSNKKKKKKKTIVSNINLRKKILKFHYV